MIIIAKFDPKRVILGLVFKSTYFCKFLFPLASKTVGLKLYKVLISRGVKEI